MHGGLFHPVSDEQIKQRFVLVTLYFDTDGDEWTCHTNWGNHSVNECEWYTKGGFLIQTQLAAFFSGFCQVSLALKRDQLQSATNVVTFNISGLKNLAGALPEEIYMLTHQKTASLAFSGLSRRHCNQDCAAGLG